MFCAKSLELSRIVYSELIGIAHLPMKSIMHLYRTTEQTNHSLFEKIRERRKGRKLQIPSLDAKKKLNMLNSPACSIELALKRTLYEFTVKFVLQQWNTLFKIANKKITLFTSNHFYSSAWIQVWILAFTLKQVESKAFRKSVNQCLNAE